MNFGLSFHVLSVLALDVILYLYPRNVNIFRNLRKLSLLFCSMLTNGTLNRLGFGMLKPVEAAMF